MKARIGILTSGGDCPGLNAVLRGVVLAADKLGWEVIGFRDGFEGLLPPGDYVVLDRKSTEGIMAMGGTILGTTNRGHFIAKVGAGDRAIVASEVIARAKTVLDDLNVKALVIVGGDGSMTTALQMQEAGINCIGVPKTIDNDIEATAMTFGFDSAVAEVMDALDRLHTTATSHKRVMVVEVMGRHSGYLALGASYGQPDILLVPEHRLNVDMLVERIREIYDLQKHCVIVCGEGIVDEKGEELGAEHASTDPAGNVALSGASEALRSVLIRRLGDAYFTS